MQPKAALVGVLAMVAAGAAAVMLGWGWAWLTAPAGAPEVTAVATDAQESAAATTSPGQTAAGAQARGNQGGLLLNADEQGLPPELEPLTTPWTGDLDAMVERRVIRLLTVYRLGGYFLDGGDQKGVTYEAAQLFEQFLNERFDTRTLKIHVAIIPVSRDELFPALVAGLGDIASANLTITPGRAQLVDFSEPAMRNVREVIVTGPSAPELAGLEDLAGTRIHVRESSSYYESLTRLNERFVAENRTPIELVAASEYLEDEDLLQMVGAGLLPMIVVDGHKAAFWQQIFDSLTVREDLAVSEGGQIAWAFRQDSPQLAEVVNEFIRANRAGTLIGNILLNRYLKNTGWVKNALAEEDLQRFNETLSFFERYADQYGFDYLMVAAQGYQESRLDQSVRSRAGAVGIMQLLPSTAADPNVAIPDISTAEPNIHAGIKYLRFLRDRYFAGEELDDFNRALLSFAAYNAGPARIAGLRRKAEAAGLDPNVWFDNVELIAAKEIGRETVQYVSNVYKYYIAYRLIVEARERRAQAR